MQCKGGVMYEGEMELWFTLVMNICEEIFCLGDINYYHYFHAQKIVKFMKTWKNDLVTDCDLLFTKDTENKVYLAFSQKLQNEPFDDMFGMSIVQ